MRQPVNLAALLVAIIVTLLSVMTMSPTIGFIDSGELAAAATTLGVPHPTGYPSLMVLGHLAAQLMPGREITALNLLAALLSGLGAGVMTLLYSYLLHRPVIAVDQERATEEVRSREKRRGKKGGRGSVSSRRKRSQPERPVLPLSSAILPALAALITALTPVWWHQGTGFEVYALQAFFLPLVIYSFLTLVDHADAPWGIEHRELRQRAFFFALLLGLSFTNHMMTILLAPAFLWFFFVRFGPGGRTWKLFPIMIVGFVIGLLPYLYIPLRAAANPPVNWGHADTPGRFIEHITGGQYQGLMFNFDVLGKQLGWYLGHLPVEFAWIGLAIALVGIVNMLRRSPKLLIVTLLLFLTTLLYAGTYAIKEIEPYFMTATLAVGIWVLFGLDWIRQKFGLAAGAGIAAAVLALGIFLNYPKVDRSDNYMAEDLPRNVLNSVPRGSIVMTTLWDGLVSGNIYLQTVEHVRPDVSVINLNMLHQRAYLAQVLDENPEFRENVADRILEFVNARKLLDSGVPVSSPTEYQRLYLRMVNGIIGSSRRPLYVTGEVDKAVGYGSYRHPEGYLLRIRTDSTYQPDVSIPQIYRLPSGEIGADEMKAALFYAEAAVRRSEYERAHGEITKANTFLQRATQYDPGVDPNDVPLLPMGNQDFVRRGAVWFHNIAVSLPKGDQE